VCSEPAQAEFAGLGGRSDPFRTHDSPKAQTVAVAVPPSVLQWRMLIHISRLLDITPELRAYASRGRLTLKVWTSWRPESPQYIHLNSFGSQSDLSIQHTAVHFLFSDPKYQHPFQSLLSAGKVRCSLLFEAAQTRWESVPEDRWVALAGTAPEEVLSGELSLESMLDGVSDGFLSQTSLMLFKDEREECLLRVTLGLVSDHTVSVEYVALCSYADAFIPTKPYFGSEVLPVTWTSSILADRFQTPAEASAASDATPAAAASDNRSNTGTPSSRPIPIAGPSQTTAITLVAEPSGVPVLSSRGAAKPEPAPEPALSPAAVPPEVPVAVAAAMAAAVAETEQREAAAATEMAAAVAAEVAAAMAAADDEAKSGTLTPCSCGSTFLPDSVFCRKCGAKRHSATTCSCGSALLPDSKFCRKCGAKRPGS